MKTKDIPTTVKKSYISSVSSAKISSLRKTGRRITTTRPFAKVDAAAVVVVAEAGVDGLDEVDENVKKATAKSPMVMAKPMELEKRMIRWSVGDARRRDTAATPARSSSVKGAVG